MDRARKRGLAAALLVAVGLAGCDSDDPGILGVGDELGRTGLRMEITPGSALIPVVGGRDTLAVSVLTASGHAASGFSVTWSSLDAGVATVDEVGTVTAQAEGSARIVARIQNLSDTATVTVTRLPAALTVTPDDLLFAELGATAVARAEVFDANGEPLDSAVSWSSSNSSVASVDASGTVTARGEGFATINAVARNVRGTLDVEVDTGAAALQLSTRALELDALEASTWFNVSAVDVLGDEVEAEFEYTVADPTVAEISGDTTLIARAEGETTLTVRAAGTSLTQALPVVVDQRAVAVNLYQDRVGMTPAQPDVDTLEAFTAFRARLEAFDANGFVFTPDAGVVWTNSDPQVLTLDTLSMVEAFLQLTDPGTATVVAQVDGFADSLVLTVTEPLSLTLSVATDTLRLFPEERATLTPVFATTESADLCCGQAVWTSADASVATVAELESDTLLVESSVEVTATGPGTTWITATRGGLRDSVYVHVSAQGYNITVVQSGPGAGSPAFDLISAAARRWEQVVLGDLPEATVSLEAGQCEPGIGPVDRMVDDLLLIVARGSGTATVNPCVVRDGGGQPVVAVLTVDAAALTATGFGEGLAEHLVGHAMGFGTSAEWEGRLAGLDTTATPTFTGANAVAAYQTLDTTAMAVPVQDSVSGSADRAHWSRSALGVEVMTGSYVAGVAHELPLSVVTVGAMADLGYATAPFRADAFSLTPPPALVGQEATDIDEFLWPVSFRLSDEGGLQNLRGPGLR